VSICNESDKLKEPEKGSMPSEIYLLPIAVNKEPTINENCSSLIFKGRSILLEARINAMSSVINSFNAIVLESLSKCISTSSLKYDVE
jgi:hypothetical protein